jgi:hypothetical protein
MGESRPNLYPAAVYAMWRFIEKDNLKASRMGPPGPRLLSMREVHRSLCRIAGREVKIHLTSTRHRTLRLSALLSAR